MKAFIEGFITGAKATPRAYFAPAIALWRLLVSTTESLLEQKTNSEGPKTPNGQPRSR